MKKDSFYLVSQWLKRRQLLLFSGLGLTAIFSKKGQAAAPSLSLAENSVKKFNPSSILQNLLPNTQWQIMTVVNPIRMPEEGGAKAIEPIIITGNTTKPETNNNLITVYCKDTSYLRAGDLLEFQSPADSKFRLSLSPLDSHLWMFVEKINSKTDFTIGLPHTCYDQNGNKSVNSNTCTAYVMTRGDMDGTAENKGVGLGPDRWWRTLKLRFWRDTWASNTKAGSQYSLGIRKTSNEAQFLWCEFNNSNLYLFADVEKIRGRQVVFGAWINHKVKQGLDSWKLFINQFDAQGNLLLSTFSTSGSYTGYQWREVTQLISLEAVKVQVGVEFLGNNNDVYYVSQPVLTYGQYLGEGNYTRQESEFLTGSNNIVPATFFGAKVNFPSSLDGASVNGYKSYGFPLRLYAETNGKIAPTIKRIIMQMEGRCDTTDRSFFIRNQEFGPHIYGIGMYSKVISMMETSAGYITLWNGNMYVYAGNSPENNNWYSVSFDISSYIL